MRSYHTWPLKVVKAIRFFSGKSPWKEDEPPKGWMKNFTVYDARKANLDFHDSGFTLVKLDKEPTVKDWRTSGMFYPDAEVHSFYKQMEPHIKKLYPGAKKLWWTHNVVRGGDVPGMLASLFRSQLRARVHQSETLINGFFI